MSRPALLLLPQILLLVAGFLYAQDRGTKSGPRPRPLIPKTEVLKLTGDKEDVMLSRDISILWLAGPEDHGGGEHDYIRVKEIFVPLLEGVDRVTVEEAFSFPTQEQFDQADLLIQYLHLPDLSDEQFAMYQNFVEEGGSVVSLHESCIMRPVEQAEKLAACIGCSWKGNRESKWSKFDQNHSVYLKTEHPVFKGLPRAMDFHDESYWDLLARDDVEVIGAVAPGATTKSGSFDEVLASPGVRSQAFWTYERGKGRVFGTTTGHYTYTFHDPLYRVLLFRGIAWAIGEDPAPLMPLVFEGITSENGQVGTTDSMLNYKNRK